MSESYYQIVGWTIFLLRSSARSIFLALRQDLNLRTYICCPQEDRLISNSIIRLSFPSHAPRFPVTVAYGSLYIIVLHPFVTRGNLPLLCQLCHTRERGLEVGCYCHRLR